LTLFIAVHKWTPEVELVITKELIAGFTANLEGKIPEDVKLCATYARADQGAWCVWHSPSKEALEKFFEEYMPTLLKYSEFVPAVQTYPPTMEYVLGLCQTIVDMASK